MTRACLLASLFAAISVTSAMAQTVPPECSIDPGLPECTAVHRGVTIVKPHPQPAPHVK